MKKTLSILAIFSITMLSAMGNRTLDNTELVRPDTSETPYKATRKQVLIFLSTATIIIQMFRYYQGGIEALIPQKCLDFKRNWDRENLVDDILITLAQRANQDVPFTEAELDQLRQDDFIADEGDSLDLSFLTRPLRPISTQRTSLLRKILNALKATF